MNTTQTEILNGTFKQVKDCIVASISDGQLYSVGHMVQICKDTFIPIQNVYYHMSCLTENISLFPQSVSEQCKGYLEKLCDDDTEESIFNIYGSKLQNYIIDSGKYTAPCEIVEDCNGLNDTLSLSTKSDSNYSDIYYVILPVTCTMLMLGGMYWARKVCSYDHDSDTAETKNVELAADALNNTQNLPNNDYAGNKYDEIVELAGDAEAV